MYKKLILLILISGLNINSTLDLLANKNKCKNKSIKAKEIKININFELLKVVNFIKSHEGFRSIPYEDVNGFTTIGYGQITKYLPIHLRKNITKIQSEEQIANKLIKGINTSKKNYPKLNNQQHLAIAHLIYCKGFGTILHHAIHKELQKGIINDSTLLYFGKFEIKYPKYKLNRQFELELFNL